MKLLIISLLTIALAQSAFGADGTVNFANAAMEVDAVVRDEVTMMPIQGPGWFAELLRVTPSGSTPIWPSAGFWSDLPGYFFGGLRTLTNVTEGEPVVLQVRVYNEARGYEGISDLVSVYPSKGLNPPPNLTGLKSWTVHSIRPNLSVKASGNEIHASWSKAYSGFSLYGTTDVVNPTWLKVTETVLAAETTYSVSFSNTQGRIFLRLQK
jgi:hypothetical protein